MWSIDQIADFVAESLSAENLRLRAEDAVTGVDALDELALHPVVAGHLERSGLGVLREHPFPSPKGSRTKRSERERCDLVLLEEPGSMLVDPVEILLRERELEGTLFHPVASRAAALPGADPRDALWVELKVCGQYELVSGVPIANSAYTTGVVRGPATDIRKLARERGIRLGVSALVLFAESEAVARHDLAIAAHRWVDMGLPIREPVVRVIPIDERIGNRVAAVCLTAVRCGGED